MDPPLIVGSVDGSILGCASEDMQVLLLLVAVRSFWREKPWTRKWQKRRVINGSAMD